MDFFQQFQQYNAQQDWLQEGQKVLLAVSGGVDSMVLTHLAMQAGWNIGLAHVNFGLRGAESDMDAALVEAFAGHHGLFCRVFKANTTEYAQQNGISIQMAARELRYNWFEELATTEGFDWIATAHNLNDSVETVLLNFTRGTGLAGLTGIPMRNGRVVRPLLFAARTDIEAYARGQQITWREDASNLEDKYARNFIRHHVVPALEKINPALLPVAARNLSRLGQTLANYRHWIRETATREISKRALLQLPAPEQFLVDWLDDFGFNAEQARQIAVNLHKSGMEWISPTGTRLVMDRDKLVLLSSEDTEPAALPIQEDDMMVTLPDGARLFRTVGHLNEPFPADKTTIVVDAARLTYPLTLRTRRPGDTFQPLGMHGNSQKIKDFFVNNKISILEKSSVWLLEDHSGQIIWVVGYRQDERFKLTPNTSAVVKFTYIPAPIEKKGGTP